MPNEFWINATADTAQNLYGIDPAGYLLLLALAFSVGFGIYLARISGNRSLGLVGLFGGLVISVFIGLLDWVYVIIPLLIFGGIYMYIQEREEQ